MKAKVIAREPFFKKYFDAKEKLAEDIRAVVSGNDFLFRGIFWGVAVAALIVSVIGLQKINHLNKVAASDSISTLLETDVEGIKDSEFYLSLESNVEKDLQPAIQKYVKDYLKSKKYSEFFDETTKEAFAKEIEQMIMKEITTNNSLTKEQESEIKKLVEEKIAAIDYSQIEEQIKNAISNLDNKTEVSIEGMEEQILEIVRKRADENIVKISDDINSSNRQLQQVINNLQLKIQEENAIRDEYNNAKFESILNQLDSNYAELIELIKTTNGRISDPTNHEYFQYGYDSTSGAAGYYIDGEFKPF